MNSPVSYIHKIKTAIAVLILCMGQAVLAHHGREVKFDPSQVLTLEGRVTKVDWANPHVHLFMVTNELEDWYVE